MSIRFLNVSGSSPIHMIFTSMHDHFAKLVACELAACCFLASHELYSQERNLHFPFSENVKWLERIQYTTPSLILVFWIRIVSVITNETYKGQNLCGRFFLYIVPHNLSDYENTNASGV